MNSRHKELSQRHTKISDTSVFLAFVSLLLCSALVGCGVGADHPGAAVTSVSPAIVSALVTPIVVTGTNFVEGTTILINGAATATKFVDTGHLSGTLVLTNQSNTTVSVAVDDPRPGVEQSNSVEIIAAFDSIVVAVSQTSVRVGGAALFTATRNGTALSSGSWTVVGGVANGTIDSNGTFHAPATVPSPNHITVSDTVNGYTATAGIDVWNPQPTAASVTPSTVTSGSTPIVVTGGGFVAGSLITLNGASIPTTFVDTGHLSGTVSNPAASQTGIQVAVLNPDPGSASSQSLTLNIVDPFAVAVSQTSVRVGGAALFTATRNGTALSSGSWTVVGGAANGTIDSNGTFHAPATVPSPNHITVSDTVNGYTATAGIDVWNPQPTAASVTPSTVTSGSTPIVVTGGGFVAGSLITLNGASIPTTFVDTGHLSGTVSNPAASQTGIQVAVLNPDPGSASSQSLTLNIVDPFAVAVSQTSVRVGGAALFTATRNGTALSSGSWTVVGGAVNGTIDSNGTFHAPAAVPSPNHITVSDTVNGYTATAGIDVWNPQPTAASVTPSTVTSGSTPIVVTGGGFVAGSLITLNGASIPTTFVDTGHLSGTVSNPAASQTGIQVAVLNPDPGSASSQSLTLNIVDPFAVAVSQTSVRVGGAALFTATRNGTALSSGSWTVVGGAVNGTIDSNGTFHAPAAVPSPNHITVSDTVNGYTATAGIDVWNPQPTATSVTPSTLSSPSSPIIVTGSGFVAGSLITVNGASISTTFFDASHLTGTVSLPSTDQTGLQIAVMNPNPGSTSSQSLTLSIVDPFVVTASQTSVRLGNTALFTATRGTTPLTFGNWKVMGGAANGIIDSDGTYHAPALVPVPNHIIISDTEDGYTANVGIDVWNPQPSATSVTPNTLSSASTPIVVTGTNFFQGSTIVVNNVPIITSFVDASHLSGNISLAANESSVQVAVVNPDPGSTSSQTLALTVTYGTFTVTPSTLTPGAVTLTLTGKGLPTNGSVLLNNKTLTISSATSTTITASGYLVPWSTGAATVQLCVSACGVADPTTTVPIQATAVSFDVAARFATQAAFGPQPGVVAHIQQIGLDSFITEQLNMPSVTYDPTSNARTQFIRAATSGSSLLRLRVALALHNFLISPCGFPDMDCLPFENLLERDATGNFRQLMTDISSDASLGNFLNLAGNAASTDPSQHPNQNFARELMQLFTLGPVLLNDDGSNQLDVNGNPIPTYTQDQVADLSRVFTGWNQATPANPKYTVFGIDFSAPLKANDAQHDQGSKLIVGQVSIPAGQGAVKDRALALDAIFQHANLPPFISRLLIQHLVKSAPTASYVSRISKVFEDDGTGVRGNLSAVTRAILLDSEARAGDVNPSSDDGFLQEPLLFQLFATNITEAIVADDQPTYYGIQMQQNWWSESTVFGSYAPTFQVPGTTINSPEFQIFNNQTAIIRSEYLWGLVTGSAPGYGLNHSSWLSTNFTNVPDLLDALDHLAFHGQMPAATRSAITLYSQQLDANDVVTQLQSALFLALNSDSYTVTH